MADNTVQVLGDLPPHFAAALRQTNTRLGALGLLTTGSQGSLVEALQRKIQSFDPTPNVGRFIDGIFGPRTQKALSAFQQANGERPMGYADDAWLQKWGITAGISSAFKSPTNPLAPSQVAVVDNSIYDANVFRVQEALPLMTPFTTKLLIAGGIAGALLALYYWRKKA